MLHQMSFDFIVKFIDSIIKTNLFMAKNIFYSCTFVLLVVGRDVVVACCWCRCALAKAPTTTAVSRANEYMNIIKTKTLICWFPSQFVKKILTQVL
jgi:hypothetical protein